MHLLEWLESRRLLTVLTFDPVSTNGVVLATGYGDRIISASQDGFTYGTTGGTTPNVTVSYGPLAKNVRQWADGYGDLHNVLFAGDAANGLLDITFGADLGYQVTLSSLDLAGGSNADYLINSIQVFDGANHKL